MIPTTDLNDFRIRLSHLIRRLIHTMFQSAKISSHNISTIVIDAFIIQQIFYRTVKIRSHQAGWLTQLSQATSCA
ncbi:MAG: hypothetical protein CMO40_08775 [Verrucomicrobiaceae bacterium]|nr:hypothetical protein [Verrucomicrobiaceae bacterium]